MIGFSFANVAFILVQMSKQESLVIIEHLLISKVSRIIVTAVRHLNNVGSVSSLGSFSSVVRIGITTSPLEVNVVTSIDDQMSWDEIVFDGRISYKINLHPN